jgi:hypothetical protein
MLPCCIASSSYLSSFLYWIIVQQLLDQIHMWEEHSTATVSAQIQLVQSVALCASGLKMCKLNHMVLAAMNNGIALKFS